MAKAFKFKLAPVLKYREIIEDEAKSRFATITQIRNTKAQELDALIGEQDHAKQEMVSHKLGNIDTFALRSLNRYITGLTMSQQRTEGELRMVDQEVEKRRLEFVEARKGVRVMEKLREKQEDHHNYLADQEQMRVFDEMALQRKRREELEEIKRQEMSAAKVRAAASEATS
ncbi:MAG: flagellar export protein FliJ [Planctomycetes bacterium]|nr:flagellar export protein FliJ [Planctomycetota bacterium]